jgi:hypothetical protein
LFGKRFLRVRQKERKTTASKTMLGCFGFNQYRRRKDELAAFIVGYRVGVGDLRSVPDDIHCGASPPMKPPALDSMNASTLATTPCRRLCLSR